MTTTAENNVFDVFRVKWDGGEGAIRPHVLQQTLYTRLWPAG